jgi:hypothetical protein
MITIWKLENDSWILIGDFEGSMEELSFELQALRASGEEYRAELRIESTSQVLEV